MAKTSRKKSTRSVFVQIFSENRHLLDQKNNDEALELYRQRTGLKITARTRQYLANVKSDLKKRGLGSDNGAAPIKKKLVGGSHLETLEHAVDLCLADARDLNHDDELKVVIQHLRAARNGLVRAAAEH